MTKLVGILGYPLSHSISPAFQQAAFDYYGLEVEYQAWPTPPEKLSEEISKLRGEQFLGANVTVPHKERVFDFLDEVDSWAETIGAVNTIVRENEKLTGCNTDAYGFIKPLKDQGEFDPRGKSVLLLGAGGAARAAAFALAAEKVASLSIANRTVERAESLASEVLHFQESIQHLQVAAISLSQPDLEDACSGIDLIVNATSIGMRHSPTEEQSPLEARMIPSKALVYDMVYNPPDTPLLIEAGRANAKILSGLPMLIYQGAAAFEKWTGEDAPIDVMFRAGERALRRMYA